MAFRGQATLYLNIIGFIFFLIGLLVIESVPKPFHRGFFCNDQSIQKPYIKQTVSTAAVVAASMLLVILTVSIFTQLKHHMFPPYRILHENRLLL